MPQIAAGMQLAESTVKGHIVRLEREIFGGVMDAGQRTSRSGHTSIWLLHAWLRDALSKELDFQS